MKIDYAFVSENADSHDGLFYVHRGGADVHYFPPDLPRPIHLGSISFIVRVVGEPHEVGQTQSLTCAIVDADGQVVNFEQRVEVGFRPHPIDPTRASGNVLAFKFFGFPVPEFGTYVFEVRQGDERLATVPFWVTPMELPEPESEQGPETP
jgi:uncharacterized protein DUF6941